MTYPDGARYEGDWRANYMEGKGTFTASNGRQFSGQWVQDKLNGKSLADLEKEAARLGPPPSTSSTSSSSTSSSIEERLKLLSKVEELSLDSHNKVTNGERLRLMANQSDLAEMVDEELAQLEQIAIENNKQDNKARSEEVKRHEQKMQAVKVRYERELREIKEKFQREIGEEATRHERELSNLHHKSTTTKNENKRQHRMLTEKQVIIQKNITLLDNQNLPKPFARPVDVRSSENPQKSEPPNEYFCPITCDLMVDPVITNEGISYEREAIENWLRRGNSRCPVTKKPLRLGDLRPNRALRNLIEAWNENENGNQTQSSSSTSSSP